MAYYLNGKKRRIAYYNGNPIFIKTAYLTESGETLTAPTISLDGDTLTMTATDERTETFAIFVDGVEMATVEVPKEEKYTVSGTWQFNETLSFDSIKVLEEVSFYSNGKQFGCVDVSSGDGVVSITYFKALGVDDYEHVYIATVDYVKGWENEAYRTITFDGVQTVSKEFYDWLTANAVRESTDLTGTTWHIPAGWTATAEYGIFKVSGTYAYGNTEYKFTSISIGKELEGIYIQAKENSICFKLESGKMTTVKSETSLTIKISGGTDTAKQKLIDWLNANGKRVITFTIDGTTYYAEEGMTWGEWVESEYNYGNLDIVVAPYAGLRIYKNGVEITDLSTKIHANGVYTSKRHEGGLGSDD